MNDYRPSADAGYDTVPLAELDVRESRPATPVEVWELDPPGRTSPPRPRMIGEIEWFDDLSPVLGSSYLVKGLLDRGAMSVIYGPSNSGKTFFALDIAFQIAVSSSWRDRRISNGTVLYLAAEGGHGVANRIVALRQARDFENVPLALRRAGLDLLHPEADVQRVIDLAADISDRGEVALIVVDTLSRVLAGGDENGPADMTAFVKNVDRIRHATGAHIMIVHHTGKDAAKGARGHSSLRAATDTEIEISVDGTIRTATVQKQRDHHGGETFHFELTSIDIGTDPDGDPVRTCVVSDVHQPATASKRPKLNKSEEVAMRAFDDAVAAHGERMTGPDYPSGVPIITREDWRKHFYRHSDSPTDSAKRQAFNRAGPDLRKKGIIEFYNDRYWRCCDNDQA